MKKMKVFLLRFAVTLVSLLTVLVLFEFYLRREVTYIVQKGLKDAGGVIQQNPEFLVQQSSRGRRFVPNAKVTIYNHFVSGLDVEVSINSLGFRGPEIPIAKPPGEKRIVVLGDSITAGDYLPESEVYVERIGHYLRESSTPVRVVNTGIGNIGIVEELNILEDSALQLSPDVVILAHYLNDTRPPWGFAGEIGDRGWLRRHSLIAETVYRNVKEYRWQDEQGARRFGWIKARDTLNWRETPEDFNSLVEAARYDWGAAWHADAEAVLTSELNRLQALARTNGFKVLVVVFPVSFQVYAESLNDEPQRLLQKLSEERGFKFLDLLPLFRAERSDTELFFDQCHPRAKANDMAGKAIAEFLKGAGIL